MKSNMNWIMEMKIAHRGYHFPNKAPENSMRAFKNAIQEGFAIELDVHILKDNHIVVFHDDNLERMTGYNKIIEECTYDEIRNLYLNNTSETIPLFSEVLSIVAGQVPLMIELKNKGKVGNLEEKLYDQLKQYKGEFVIQSFNPYSVGWFYKHAPEIIRGQLSGSYKKENMGLHKKILLRYLLLNKISKPDFINYEIDYLACFAIHHQKNKGVPILGWTARNATDYKKALKQCCNAVFEGFNPKEYK